MHRFASFNSRLINSSEPTLAALSQAAIYAKGVFTTLAIHNSTPFLFDKHWRRLKRDAHAVGVDISAFDEDGVAAALQELLEANGAMNCRARITAFGEYPSDLWPYESKRMTSLLVTTADLIQREDRLKLTSSPYRINSTSPLSGVKSCNYLEKIIAKDEARSRGFDEAIQLNERGEIASACMANLFWIRKGKLLTPSLKTGCLAGTTRECVLEKIDCEEVAAGSAELLNADQIFLTSAGLGVAPVAQLDDRELDIAEHPIVNLIACAA